MLVAVTALALVVNENSSDIESGICSINGSGTSSGCGGESCSGTVSSIGSDIAVELTK